LLSAYCGVCVALVIGLFLVCHFQAIFPSRSANGLHLLSKELFMHAKCIRTYKSTRACMLESVNSTKSCFMLAQDPRPRTSSWLGEWQQ
jgi:hypothetical protein